MAAPSPFSPTRIRWRIALLLFAISVVTYMDRVNISVTARQMMPALGLTDFQMGEVFSAFVVGYALCQIPGGWLGDRWGATRVLAAAVVWWSAFTALTAVAAILPTAPILGSVGSLVLVRFLVGVGEAAALPNFNRTVANWFAPHERGLGIGLAIGGIGIGSAMTPPITAWIMVNYGWQTAFYASALFGVVIAAVWYGYATDRPADHRHVNQAERDVIAGDGARPAATAGLETTGGWRTLARTTSVWWLVASYTCLGYVAYIYMSWFYLYLVNVRGFTGALFASSPFLAMAVFCPLGGWATDRLALRFGTVLGRGLVGGTGMTLACLSILLGAFADSPWLALTWLSLGAGWLYFPVGAYWASTVDLSKRHAGALSGLMNTGANLGGAISPMLTPWLADRFGWAAALGFGAIIALAGGLMWIKIHVSDERFVRSV